MVVGEEGWIVYRAELVVAAAVVAAGPGEGTVGAPALAWGAVDGASVGAEGQVAAGRAGCCAWQGQGRQGCESVPTSSPGLFSSSLAPLQAGPFPSHTSAVALRVSCDRPRPPPVAVKQTVVEEAACLFAAHSRSVWVVEEEEEGEGQNGRVGRRPLGRNWELMGFSSGQGRSCGCPGT